MMREASKDSSTDRIMVELGVDSGAANLANDLENNLKAVSKKAELISLDTGIADSGVSRQIEAYNLSLIHI